MLTTEEDDDIIFETLVLAMGKLKQLGNSNSNPIIILNNDDYPRVKKCLKKRGYKITKNGTIKRTIKSNIFGLPNDSF